MKASTLRKLCRYTGWSTIEILRSSGDVTAGISLGETAALRNLCRYAGWSSVIEILDRGVALKKDFLSRLHNNITLPYVTRAGLPLLKPRYLSGVDEGRFFVVLGSVIFQMGYGSSNRPFSERLLKTSCFQG